MKILNLLIAMLSATLVSSCPQAQQESSTAASTQAGNTSHDESSELDHDSAGHDEGATQHDEAGKNSGEQGAAADDMHDRHDMDGVDGDVVNPCAEIDSGIAAAAMETVSNLSRYLVTGDRDAYIACFHPESPELEEMTEMFDEIQKTIVAVQVVNNEVVESSENLVVLEYEFSISESGKEQYSESGTMEMMKNETGNWVIFDLN